MPLTRIEIVKGKSKEYKEILMQSIHDVMQDVLGVPDENRIQRLYELEEENFVLGSTKSKKFTLIELTIFPGRSKEIKERLIVEITTRLGTILNIQPIDVFIIINEPSKENWGVRGELLMNFHVDNANPADDDTKLDELNMDSVNDEEAFDEEQKSKIDDLEFKCKLALDVRDRETFHDAYNDIWDIYDEIEEDDDEKRIYLAAKLSDLTFLMGNFYYNNNMYFDIVKSYNDSYSFAKNNPDVFECAMACVKLGTAQLETKFTIQEFENVESYIDELLPITKRFPEHEEFTMESAACLCNLLQICPYDHGVFMSRMMDVLDQILILGEQFPLNPALQLCVLRSIVFFLCYSKPRLRDDLYEKYYEIGKERFASKQELISKDEMLDMKLALMRCAIKF